MNIEDLLTPAATLTAALIAAKGASGPGDAKAVVALYAEVLQALKDHTWNKKGDGPSMVFL